MEHHHQHGSGMPMAPAGATAIDPVCGFQPYQARQLWFGIDGRPDLALAAILASAGR